MKDATPETIIKNIELLHSKASALDKSINVYLGNIAMFNRQNNLLAISINRTLMDYRVETFKAYLKDQKEQLNKNIMYFDKGVKQLEAQKDTLYKLTKWFMELVSWCYNWCCKFTPYVSDLDKLLDEKSKLRKEACNNAIKVDVSVSKLDEKIADYIANMNEQRQSLNQKIQEMPSDFTAFCSNFSKAVKQTLVARFDDFITDTAIDDLLRIDLRAERADKADVEVLLGAVNELLDHVNEKSFSKQSLISFFEECSVLQYQSPAVEGIYHSALQLFNEYDNLAVKNLTGHFVALAKQWNFELTDDAGPEMTDDLKDYTGPKKP